MKKILLLFSCIFYFIPLGNAQEANKPKIIYLYDGSFFQGKILEKVEGSIYKIELTGGSVIIIDEDSVLKIVEQKNGYSLQRDGRRMLSKGWYNSLSIQTLNARQAQEFPEAYRWSLGVHYSRGYYFNQKLAAGAGIGLDLHEIPFVPVFWEITGYFTRKKIPENPSFKTRYPFTYNLQIGYNIPINEKDNDFEEISGGWLVYPSVGFMLGSRRGSSFKIDFGYKFQKYQRTFVNPWWSEYSSVDQVLLKSFAVRTSWVF